MNKKTHQIIAFVIYSLIVFVIDIQLPLGVATGFMYIPALLIFGRQDRRVLIILICLSVVLEILGYFFSPTVNVPMWIPIVNRTMSIILLCFVYYALKSRIIIGELRSLITICAWTKQVRVDGEWLSIEEFLKKYLEINITHGISPEAAQKLSNEVGAFLKK